MSRAARGIRAALAAVAIALLLAPAVAGAQDADDPTTTTATTATTEAETTTSTTAPAEPAPTTTAPPATVPDTGVPGTTAGPPATTAPTTAPEVDRDGTGGGGVGDGAEDESSDEPTATTLPSGPPPGFTQEQFDTFVRVVGVCGTEPGAVCTRLFDWTGNAVLAETAQWVVDLPLRFLLVLLVAFVANRIVRRVITSSAARWEKRRNLQLDDGGPLDSKVNARQALRVATASSTLTSAATVVIYTLAAFAALWQLDIDLTPFFAGAGIAGVALGFGAQNLVRDILAGFFVIVEDQYGIGDVIDFGKASGTVEDISLRVTKVRDVEGTLWFVPNGIISEVGNMSQRWSRVILDIDVAYRADHHLAGELIKAAADELWRSSDPNLTILEEPELWGVQSLAESAVVIRLAIKCAPAHQWAVGRELRSRIKDRFDEAGIEIPFPQQTMWVRNDDPPTEPEPA